MPNNKEFNMDGCFVTGKPGEISPANVVKCAHSESAATSKTVKTWIWSLRVTSVTRVKVASKAHQ
jgi:hypothetical protein